MIRIFISDSFEEAKEQLRFLKNDVCIVHNNRDGVFVITYDDFKEQVDRVCNVQKITDWSERDVFHFMGEFRELKCICIGRKDFIDNATII